MARRNGNTVAGVWRCFTEESVSSSNTQTTIVLECNMESIAWGINIHNFYAEANINGNVKSTSTASFYSGTGQTVQKNLVRHTVTYNRTTSAQTKTLTAKIVNSTGYKNGTSTCSFAVTVPALPSYKVSYNANGGSGAPGAQTKWYGTTLKLSSTKPTRTGYTFQGWATSSGGSVAYAAGANYTSNSAVTLYAVWKANTWTISYNANGGSGAPGAQTKTYGVTLKLSSTRPTRTNYNFLGWATSSTATSAQYQPGGSFTTNATTTLYAVWKLAYVAPRITNLAANRCNSAGTYTEDGTYAKIAFNWAADRTVSSVKIVCNGVTTTVSGQSGTSGSVSQVVGAGALNIESQYTVSVTVADTTGSSTSTTVVAPLSYIMDFAPNGSVGIGKPAASSERLFEVDIPARFTNVVQGFTGQGHTGTQKVKIIARGKHTNASTSSLGHMRIFGSIGGWTAGSKGAIDIYIPTRSASQSTFEVNAYSPTLIGNTACYFTPRISSSDGYVYLLMGVNDYYSYNFIIEGQDIEIIDSDWLAAPGISGTDIFNTTAISTAQFGGYPLKVEKLNGHFGFALPDKTRNEWMRTTYNGMIPYQAGGASALGTNTWPFNTAWINQLNWTGNGLRGRCFKKIWSGTANEGATITVSEMPYYNLFAFEISTYSCMIPVIRGKNLDSDTYYGLGGYGINGGDNARIVSITCNASGSSTRIKLDELNIAGSANITDTANTSLVGIYGIL